MDFARCPDYGRVVPIVAQVDRCIGVSRAATQEVEIRIEMQGLASVQLDLDQNAGSVRREHCRYTHGILGV